jgi:hypothetical protein
MNYELRIMNYELGVKEILDELRIMNYECWVREVKHRLLSSIKKAKRLLGHRAQMGFEDGSKKVDAWFIETWGDIERSVTF